MEMETFDMQNLMRRLVVIALLCLSSCGVSSGLPRDVQDQIRKQFVTEKEGRLFVNHAILGILEVTRFTFTDGQNAMSESDRSNGSDAHWKGRLDIGPARTHMGNEWSEWQAFEKERYEADVIRTKGKVAVIQWDFAEAPTPDKIPN